MSSMAFASLNEGWEFVRGGTSLENLPGVLAPWAPVTLPHDWSIHPPEGLASPFSRELSDGGPASGYAIGGVGWYRRSLSVSEAGVYEFDFDGIYFQAEFWIDGVKAGASTSGYMPYSFRAELSEGDHEISIRVRNPGHNSRWYSGSGIYRPAAWRRLPSTVRLAWHGVYPCVVSASAERAVVEARIEVEALQGAARAVVEVASPDGKVVARAEASVALGANVIPLAVENPILWHLAGMGDQPIYRLKVSVADEASSWDEEVAFGIRSVEVSAEKGLFINGERALLKGGCLHHDHGILGAAAHPGAEERRLRLLLSTGYNAIRCAHNPPSSAFLDLCDELGVAVIDEAFDEWERPKNTEGYGFSFREWSGPDLERMVRRDRRHPSVLFWSIGNEIPGCFTRPDIAERLRQETLALDETRLITAGVCSAWWPDQGWVDWPTSSDVAFESLDVAGINYLIPQVETDHARNPQRVMMHTETYPLSTKDAWKQATELPYVIGDFVWTCFDYLGESGIGLAYPSPDEPRRGNFPLHMAMCGDFEITGVRKPQSFGKEALWKEGVLDLASGPSPEARGWERQTEIFHQWWNWNLVENHWTWPGWEGKIVQVDIYSSCHLVELFVNGTSVGTWNTSSLDNRWTTVEIPYEPGELKAVGRFGDQEVVSRLVTTGAPSRLSARLEGTFGGIHFVEVSLVDKAGAVVLVEDHPVTLSLSEGLSLLAFGNGSPIDVSSVTDLDHRTHKGRALAVLAGTGVVKVGSVGLEGAALEIG